MKNCLIKARSSLAKLPRTSGAPIASSTVRLVMLSQINTHQSCANSVLEHGSAKHRQMALDHLVTGLLEFATNEQGSKSVTKALKEGGKETLDRIVKRMAESTKGYGGASCSHCDQMHALIHQFPQWPQSDNRRFSFVCYWEPVNCFCPAERVWTHRYPRGLDLTATSSGRQGPAHTFVRVDPWAHRHPAWLQDGFEGYLVIVSVMTLSRM